jgi:hypothetical protein
MFFESGRRVKGKTQEMKMKTNTEGLNRDASTNMLSAIEDARQLISELEDPKYRHLIRFAVAFQAFGRTITEFDKKIHERAAEKPISSVNELLQKLIKKD